MSAEGPSWLILVLDPARRSCLGWSCLCERLHLHGSSCLRRSAGPERPCLSGQQDGLKLLLQAAVPTCCLPSLASSADHTQWVFRQLSPLAFPGRTKGRRCGPSMAQQEKHRLRDGVSEQVWGSALHRSARIQQEQLPEWLLKRFPIKPRASISLREIDSSGCLAGSMGDGFSIICTTQLRLEEKIIRPHSVPLNVSMPSKSSGRSRCGEGSLKLNATCSVGGHGHSELQYLFIQRCQR